MVELVKLRADFKVFEFTYVNTPAPTLQERLKKLADEKVYLKKDEATVATIEEHFQEYEKLSLETNPRALADNLTVAKGLVNAGMYKDAYNFYNVAVQTTRWDTELHATAMAHRGLCLAAAGVDDLESMLEIQCAASHPRFPLKELHMYYIRLGQWRMNTGNFQGANWAFSSAINAIKTYLLKPEQPMWESKCLGLMIESEERMEKQLKQELKLAKEDLQRAVANLQIENPAGNIPSANGKSSEVENNVQNVLKKHQEGTGSGIMDKSKKEAVQSSGLSADLQRHGCGSTGNPGDGEKEDFTFEKYKIKLGPDGSFVGATLVATCDLNSSEILGTDVAVYSVPNPAKNWNTLYCWTCFTRVEGAFVKAVVPCERCNFVRFCSLKCFHEGKNLHARICRYLPVVMKQNEVWGPRMGLAFVAVMSVDPKDWAKMAMRPNGKRTNATAGDASGDAGQAEVPDPGWSELPTGENDFDGYADLFGLDTYLRRSEAQQRWIASAAEDLLKIYVCTEHWADFISCLPGKEEAAFYFVGNLIARLLSSMLSYAWLVEAPAVEKVMNAATGKAEISTVTMDPIGLGLLPRFSYAQHSCFPNAVVIFEGKKATLVALRPIKNGEVITVAWNWPFLREDNKTERRWMFFTRFGRDCECVACKGVDWANGGRMTDQMKCAGCQKIVGVLGQLERAFKAKGGKRKMCVCPTPGCKMNYRDVLQTFIEKRSLFFAEKQRLIANGAGKKGKTYESELLAHPNIELSDLVKHLEYCKLHLVPYSPYIMELVVVIGTAFSFGEIRRQVFSSDTARRKALVREMLQELRLNFPTFKPSNYSPRDYDEDPGRNYMTDSAIDAAEKELARNIAKPRLDIRERERQQDPPEASSEVDNVGECNRVQNLDKMRIRVLPDNDRHPTVTTKTKQD